MGIMDFFKRNKNNEQMQQVRENGPDLSLKYKSGIVCEVRFEELEQMQIANGQTRMIQNAVVTYVDDKTGRIVGGKKVILDPQVMQDQQGNTFYATELYYKTLAEQNIGLVKGFFQKDQVGAIENNYIGYIGVDPKTGAYNRSYDWDLKKYYDEVLKQKKEMQNYNEEQRFEQSLREQTEKIENIKPNVKTSHAQVLTKEDYEQYYGNR